MLSTIVNKAINNEWMPWNYRFSVLLVGRVWFKRSFPPGFDEALPYHIIPITAMTIPKTTWTLRPSLPKKRNPNIKTSIVFMWPSTWNETAVNLPMQINWLRLVPTAIVHDIIMNICKSQHKVLVKVNVNISYTNSCEVLSFYLHW